MWIKNLTVFLGAEPFPWSAAELEERLEQHRCPPCGRQSLSSEGFVPPLKGEDRMVVVADGLPTLPGKIATSNFQYIDERFMPRMFTCWTWEAICTRSRLCPIAVI